jgi:hypothetical protein
MYITKTAILIAVTATVAGLLAYALALEVWCWAYGILY